MNATVTTQVIAIQSDALNCNVYEVTALPDGMEAVEYVGNLTWTVEDEALQARVHHAKAMALATGSNSATITKEGPGGVVESTTTYYRNRYHAQTPRLTRGVHKAKVTKTPEQAALATEMATQRDREPVTGARWIVSELTGYLLVQNRPLDHRSCHCGDGVTTYHAGVVESVTAYMDNSVEVRVRCQDGKVRTVTTVAPHGDACF